MRTLSSTEVNIISGAVADPSVYYTMGHAIGDAYWYARGKVADFYEWVANL